MEPRPSPRSILGSRAAIAAGLAAICLLLYARTTGFPFVDYDDNVYVFENAFVRQGLSWPNLRWALGTLDVWNWHPLTWLSYMLDVSLFGVSPGAMHGVNALLHALNAGLVFLFLERATGARWRSVVVAALFALHPTRVESVAWIAERKDVLSSFFGLLALLAYVAYARRPSLGRYAAVAVSFAASLASKAMLVTLPFLLIVLDAWPLRRLAPWSPAENERADVPTVSWRRAVLEKVPLLALSIACSVVNLRAQDVNVIEHSVGSRAGILVSYLRYLGLLAWPVDLAVHYPLVEEGYPGWLIALGAAVLLGISTAAVRAARRAPWIAAGWFWFVGTLVPVIGLVQIGRQSIAVRYTYFPAIGLFVALAWGAATLARRAPRFTAALALVVAGGLATSTWRHVGRWADPVVLFRHTIDVTPPNARVELLLSAALRNRGDMENAIAHAREAVRLEPGDERYWVFLGRLAKDLGQVGEAEGALMRALAIDDAYGDAWRTLGDLQRERGRVDDAIASYRAVLRLDAADAGTWSDMGALLVAAGRDEDALAAFRAGIDARPSDPLLWGNLGVFHARRGEWPLAALAFRQAADLRPDEPGLLGQLAFAQLQAGDRDGALATAQRLEALDAHAASLVRASASQAR